MGLDERELDVNEEGRSGANDETTGEVVFKHEVLMDAVVAGLKNQIRVSDSTAALKLYGHQVLHYIQDIHKHFQSLPASQPVFSLGLFGVVRVT